MADAKMMFTVLYLGIWHSYLVRYEHYVDADRFAGILEVQLPSVYTEEGRLEIKRGIARTGLGLEILLTGNESHAEAENIVGVRSAVVAPSRLSPYVCDGVRKYNPVTMCHDFGKLYGDVSYCRFGNADYLSTSGRKPVNVGQVLQQHPVVVAGEQSLVVARVSMLKANGNEVVFPKGNVEFARQAVFAGALSHLISEEFGCGMEKAAEKVPLIADFFIDPAQLVMPF